MRSVFLVSSFVIKMALYLLQPGAVENLHLYISLFVCQISVSVEMLDFRVFVFAAVFGEREGLSETVIMADVTASIVDHVNGRVSWL